MLHPGLQLLLGGFLRCVDSAGVVSRDGADVDELDVLARPDIVVASSVVEPTSYFADRPKQLGLNEQP